jgi:hypothetical protein
MNFSGILKDNNFNSKHKKPFIYKGFERPPIQDAVPSGTYPDKDPDLHTFHSASFIPPAGKQLFRLPAKFHVHNLRPSKYFLIL